MSEVLLTVIDNILNSAVVVVPVGVSDAHSTRDLHKFGALQPRHRHRDAYLSSVCVYVGI